MQRYWARREHWLFPKEMSTSDVLKQLRRVDQQLECRSIRRGALQSMAVNGVAEDIIMMISGHTQRRTLHRYLAWGKDGLLCQRQMTEASKKMFSSEHRGGSAGHTRYDGGRSVPIR